MALNSPDPIFQRAYESLKDQADKCRAAGMGASDTRAHLDRHIDAETKYTKSFKPLLEAARARVCEELNLYAIPRQRSIF